jgi:selenide,water dikinase
MGFLSECTSGGCGAKIGPGELAGLLKEVPGLGGLADQRLLVGFASADDAAVYQLSPDLALVSTVDFFSPMIDDPWQFGQIAAANALSDVYAMGGTPLFALNLVCFPQKMDKGILKEVLAGGAAKVGESGAVIAGGHSIYDHEPKYGLAVTGRIHPDKILYNNGCREGDCLILTKPLGVGLVTAAARAGAAGPELLAAVLASMTRLNRYAAEKMKDFPVSACTDITGFGLLVHGMEMAGQEHTLVIDTDSLPLLPGAYDFAAGNYATAGGQRNANFFGNQSVLESVSPAMREILFDPQTSGGLLISLPADKAQALCDAIRQDDPQARIIGQVTAREKNPVILV